MGDEATSALDPISSKKIDELFVKLKNEYSIVLVTHTLRQAKRIADYIVFMYLGEVTESCPASELFDNPKCDLTREYLFWLLQLEGINTYHRCGTQNTIKRVFLR